MRLRVRLVTAEECQGLAMGRMHWGIASATHALPTARPAAQLAFQPSEGRVRMKDSGRKDFITFNR